MLSQPAGASFKRALFFSITLIGPLLVTLGLVEGGLRLMNFRSPVIHAEMFTPNDGDPLLPFTLRAGYRGSFGGGAVQIGPDGHRVVLPARNATQASIEPDIIVVGDSVAFGHSLNDEDTIASNLQRLIASQGGRRRVAMVAVPGYTSWNEYAALSRYRSLDKAKLVVLIYVTNDITMDNDHFKFRQNPGRIYYLERDGFRKLTRFFYDHSRLFYLVADSAKRALHLAAHADHEPSAPLDIEALHYSMQAVEKMRDLCGTVGATFLVALYRDGAIYRNPDGVRAIEGAIASELRALGVRHLVLERTTSQLDKNRFSVSWNDDTHPSAEASRIIAQELADAIGRADLAR